MYYYHWVVADHSQLSSPPTLDELTDFVQGEIGSEGNFGPYERLKAVWFRQVKYRGRKGERAYKVRVTGPAKDITIIRDNLRAEYGRLTPRKEDFPEEGI